MATLSIQQIGITGLEAAYVSAGGSGDKVAPGPHTFLHVKNANGSSINVTVAVPGQEYGQNRADVVVAVANGAQAFIGPLVDDLADSSDDLVHVSYSATSGVTVAALRG